MRTYPAILLAVMLALAGHPQAADHAMTKQRLLAGIPFTSSASPATAGSEFLDVQRLRKLVAGVVYDSVLTCFVVSGPRRAPATSDGCNEKERRGHNWWTLKMPSVQWQFPDDRAARLWLLLGIPDESTGRLRWTCGKDAESRDRPAWFWISADGMHVLFSCDRPPDDDDYRPAVRYEYYDLSVGR